MTTESPATASVLRTWLGRVTITFLIFGTAIAVVGLLRGDLRPVHVRWMFTAFVGAIFLAVAQASTASWDRKRLLVGRLGQVSSLLGFAVFIWGLWFHGYENPMFWRAEIILFFVSLASAHSSLLAFARVPPPMVWMRAVSITCAWFVTGSVVFMVLASWAHPEWIRWLGVLSLLWISSSFVLAIVHRLEDPESEDTEA